ncbi:hypothetical protein Leryth_014322, partial [Lithospermum erythrorhizon]
MLIYYRTSLMAWFMIYYYILTFALFSHLTFSQSIVDTLPGFPGELPFKLETGYVGVGESENVQLFYYFIDSENNPKEDPLILWLTGGPGCSCLSVLLYQMGPFAINYTGSTGEVPTLRVNPYAWTKVANIIFVDQPAGTGYSYGKDQDSYMTSDSLSASSSHEFLKKWLLLHPRFLANSLYIAGDSYTGIIIPPLVQEIYNGNEVGAEPLLNIKGYILGNPLTDHFINFNSRLTFAHRMALLSDNLYESTKTNCNGNFLFAEPGNLLCHNDLQRIAKCLEKIQMSNILEPWCGSKFKGKNLLPSDQSSAESYPTDILQQLHPVPKSWCRDDHKVYSYTWANANTVKEALRVREGTILEWIRCNMTMFYVRGKEGTDSYIYDIKSTIDTHKNLTHRRARALIY